MPYSEYTKAGSSIVDFLLWLLWNFIVYFPFILPGVKVYEFFNSKIKLHGFVAFIFGALVSFILYALMARLEHYRKSLPKESFHSKLLLLFSILLLAGFPFIFGWNTGIDIVGRHASLFEKVIAGGFCGIMLGWLSYSNIQKSWKKE